LVFELEHVFVGVDLHFSNSIKTGLDLGGYDREHLDRNTIELVEAAPSARLGETHENLTHRLIVHLVRAVEDDDLETESTTKILGSFGLTGTSGTSGSTTHAQIESLG
jgi:hypothetical protein